MEMLGLFWGGGNHSMVVATMPGSRFKNNFSAKMWSGSKEGSIEGS